MSLFLTFVAKEFKHILRDRRTMLVLFGIPFLQILMFGFALTTEVNQVKLAVLVPHHSLESQRIVQQFDALKTFDVVAEVRNEREIDALFRNNTIQAALVFEPQFAVHLKTGTARMQILVDGSEPNTARTIAHYAQSVVENRGNALLKVETRMLYNPQAKSSYNFVPGVMGLVLILICAMMTSVSVVRERETGSMELLLVSPVRPLTIIVCKLLPYFVLSLLIVAIILTLSVFVLGVPIAGSLPLLLFASLLYILTALALGFLISTFANSQMVALLVSGMLLMMPVILLSGMIFPIEGMPAVFQWISTVVPARWYIAAVRKIMIEGLPLALVWKELTILLTMTVVLIAISLAKFKIHNE